MEMVQLGIKVQLQGDFEAAVARVTEALKAEGFGVLTEIDVRATMKKKLDVEFRNYKILGACNPPLAYRALSATAEVGLLLPCNVTVDETAPGQVEVAFLNPLTMTALLPAAGIEPVAVEARQRLERVAAALSDNRG